MSISIIIGKSFGDEGKGLATDYFAAKASAEGKSCLVIRHNGGAQAGHTVDLPDRRFVFHQLSSGSLRNADTYWAQTFLPDLYKLPEEAEEFLASEGRLPRIIAHPLCRCVYIDDILINMALESSRGQKRHGSCGMGINEASERSSNREYCIHLGDIYRSAPQELCDKLMDIRRTYLPKRLEQLGLSLDQMGEYGEMLSDRNVIKNASEQMHSALQLITLSNEDIISAYDDIIFEGAQGLMLDEDCIEFAPHLTSSKTGSDNPLAFLSRYAPNTLPELVYVTRSYVTRHGAGDLPWEDEWKKQKISVSDPTNIPNPWQGILRFAPHGSTEEFFSYIHADISKFTLPHTVSCMITHLNESYGKICCIDGNIPVTDWVKDKNFPEYIGGIYLSSTPFSKDISYLSLQH
ncbi:MAG: adenylosuccinate synthetase [Clostridia bacterium]|nr:adenylosuccinate synthetase [Clostridia bacterium]